MDLRTGTTPPTSDKTPRPRIVRRTEAVQRETDAEESTFETHMRVMEAGHRLTGDYIREYFIDED